MMNLNEKYPEVWIKIKKREIEQKDIVATILNLAKKILSEIKHGTRNEEDIGDIFGIYMSASSNGYKFKNDAENFFLELGEYKVEINGKKMSSLTLKQIEQKIKELEGEN
jgi:hypothetical protein